MLTTLSDTADTIERWFKVQQMWTSLESRVVHWAVWG